MKEILFRGRAKYSGEWVYGDLIQFKNQGRFFIHPQENISETKGELMKMIVAHEVDKETVSKWTGFEDVHAQKVFEGDILQVCKKTDAFGNIYTPSIEKSKNVIVIWDLCSYTWEIINSGICEQRYMVFPEAWCYNNYKIIGNIYDNPELLEVKQ